MRFVRFRSGSLGLLSLAVLILAAGVSEGTLPCGPFTDMSGADPFCNFVLEIFTLGITTGTTPTTYDPSGNVTRVQMAAFLSRSVDGVLKRGSRRAAIRQFWTPQNETVLGSTSVPAFPLLLRSDGVNVWVASLGGQSVSRVRGTDGKLTGTWTGAGAAWGVLVAMGRVFVTGQTFPGNLYRIDPGEPPGAVTTVASTLGMNPRGIAYDGSRIWTSGVSISIVTPGPSIPWTVTTVAAGFTAPNDALFDGANVWITDQTANKLFKLDAGGAILQTVTVGLNPRFPVFDGANIWVPNSASGSISVIRASSGSVIQTLTGNGLFEPVTAAFDGQRVLVTNQSGNSVSLWKAADLTPWGSFPTGPGTMPVGACSDGVNFWIGLSNSSQIARF